jgi:isocitrate dehydrogenase
MGNLWTHIRSMGQSPNATERKTMDKELLRGPIMVSFGGAMIVVPESSHVEDQPCGLRW